MSLTTYLNPDVIKDGSISASKIDGTVASKSYVDDTIAATIYTKSEVDDITSRNKGLITELATAGNGYNVKLDWSPDTAKENTIDPAYRGQVNLGAGCTTSMAWAYAEGTGNTASGNASHAEGQSNTASGSRAHVEGLKNTASGQASHAEGASNTASGTTSHVECQQNTASGAASHAEGVLSTASGDISHVEGQQSIASGVVSHAEGFKAIASGDVSHAQGSYTVASGKYSSTAIGAWVFYLKLTGDANTTVYTCNISEITSDNPDYLSYLIGPNNYGYIIIVGTNSIAPVKITSVDASTGTIEVESTLSPDASLDGTECTVASTLAFGNYSFAARGVAAGGSAWTVNRGGFAKGANSFVGGNCNSAYNDSEVAFGHFNKSVESSDTALAPIATIGIGADKDHRKNAIEIMQNGDAYLIGIGKYDGTNSESATRLQDIIPTCENITYSALVDKRDAGQLIPGMQYRITDYTCTTVQENTRSANHQFDIIVTADSESVLNEVARAVKHEGDTYFANNDLSAWKIWYCLDNDTTRFAWADSTNGKGVIYRMIDEWNNDVPYDFKNIQFKHPNDTATYPHYYYTFASDNVEDNTDCSLDIANSCYSNTIMEYIKENIRSLNQIVFIGTMCYSNSFAENCFNNSFDAMCINNSFGTECSSNRIGQYCTNNSFNSYCVSNSLGIDCHSNIFGFVCGENTLGNSCTYNTFRPDCSNNSFAENCYGNTFEEYCSRNTFDTDCCGNSFGSSSSDNTFGNSCSYNSLGNKCNYIKFASDKSSSTKYDNYQNNHFGDGCEYIVFTGTETSSTYVQNYNFAQGLQGTYSTYLTVDGVRGRVFETKVAQNSNGELKIYCEADLIK